LKRLFTILAAAIVAVLGLFAQPSFAADAAHGASVFSANCAACHLGGNNVVQPQKTLKKDALAQFLTGYADGPEAAVINQVTNGKGGMPAFGAKLSAGDIADVAAYVISQSENGWQ
jgi:cytochrome c6